MYEVAGSGEFRGGKLFGEGIAKYANGDVYRGQFKDGIRCGTGEMVYINLPSYERFLKDGTTTMVINTDAKDEATYKG